MVRRKPIYNRDFKWELNMKRVAKALAIKVENTQLAIPYKLR
jgi:hypothetical protein